MKVTFEGRLLLITLLLIGLLNSSAQAATTERSLRGNRDIPTRDIANGLAPRLWKELRNQEYTIYLKVLVEAQPDGSVRIEEILERDPVSVSEQVAHKLVEEVELFYPRIGNRIPPHGIVHLMLYRHTSEGPLALIHAKGLRVPEHVAMVEDFFKIVWLAPASP